MILNCFDARVALRLPAADDHTSLGQQLLLRDQLLHECHLLLRRHQHAGHRKLLLCQRLLVVCQRDKGRCGIRRSGGGRGRGRTGLTTCVDGGLALVTRRGGDLRSVASLKIFIAWR
jgi:hypothetical protein